MRSRLHVRLQRTKLSTAGADPFIDELEAVDLIFDTVGGEFLVRAPSLLERGGRLVSVAAEPPGEGPTS
jgi:NADPH:quinone reductase-like Zn-dependent oxidoreductase